MVVEKCCFGKFTERNKNCKQKYRGAVDIKYNTNKKKKKRFTQQNNARDDAIH